MTQVAQGQLSDRPLVRTLYTIAAKRFTGDFVVSCTTGTYKLAWHRGFVVGADTPGGGALAEQASALFELLDGEFVLDDESSVATPPGTRPLDPRWLILRGVAAHFTPERLAQELAVIAKHAIQLKPQASNALPAYGFDDADNPSLELLAQKPWRLQELEATRPDLDLHRLRIIVYALLTTDALALTAAATSQAAARARAAPAPAAAAASDATAASPAAPEAPSPAASKRAAAPTAAQAAAALRTLIEQRSALADDGADHFQLLGLDVKATGAQIRSTYFELAKQLHPDRVRSLGLIDIAERAQKLFAQMNEAFKVLGNDEQRREYVHLVESGLVNEDEAETEAKMLRILEAEEAFQLGELAMRRSHWSQARQDFKKAAELNPEEGEHHALWAWAEWNYAPRDQRPALAEETRRRFRKAVVLSPRNPSIYFFRGQVGDELRELESARWCYRKVLRLEPEHEGANKALRTLDEAASAAAAAPPEPEAPAAD